jgi:hypothetical protein
MNTAAPSAVAAPSATKATTQDVPAVPLSSGNRRLLLIAILAAAGIGLLVLLLAVLS